MTFMWLVASVHDLLASMTVAKGGLIVASTAGIILAFLTVGLYIARRLLAFAIRTIRTVMPMMLGVSLLVLGTAGVAALKLFS